MMCVCAAAACRAAAPCARSPLVHPRPSPLQVYGTACDLSTSAGACQFQNPLAFSPFLPASSLQCIRSAFSADLDSVSAGVCRLGPQKQGDGCIEDGECASGTCTKEMRMCRGVDEGEECKVGFPDPCQSDHYCMPETSSMLGGRCAKSVSLGRSCTYPGSCARGSYCSSAARGMTGTCTPLFSLAAGTNTTLGVYMCASGTGIAAAYASSVPDTPTTSYPTLQCVDPAVTMAIVGTECDPAVRAPMGYACSCSADGKTRLRTLGGGCSSAGCARRATSPFGT